MPITLVVVESPAKAKTIKNFLGAGYDVQASFGHIRDLPEKKDQIPAEFRSAKWAQYGVNIEDEFQPIYVIPPDKKKYVEQLKASARSADSLLLATDEDREGESISWHVLQVLKPRKGVQVRRIVFHEITEEAIRAALANPREIDEGLVRAQETRRILDRLYGYTLSPLLWRKVRPNLSAGRVQSVAVRLIVQRERERRDFVVADYSGVEADLAAAGGDFTTKLARVRDLPVADGDDFGPDGQLKRGATWLRPADAEPLAVSLAEAKPWTVAAVETKPGQENPPVPFMTSTLQQEANRKLGMTAKRSMQIAQQLYEGIDIGGDRVGLITYMRTDSLTLAERAIAEARAVIKDLYGPEHVPDQPKRYKSKAKNAQEAHEAIRPTDLARRPQDIERYLDKDQARLYELIWKRTLACQMKPAKVERTRVEAQVEHGSKAHTFTASGKRIVFPGFLKVYVEGADDPDAELGDREKILPELKQGQTLSVKAVRATEHATRPPARFTEASLVRKLEDEGVGRPSTYASIISTIQDRGYVNKSGNELVPTFIAFAVTELLENHFDELVDTGFTAKMEEELDLIADGKRDWVQHLKEFFRGTQEHPGLQPQIEEKGRGIPFPAMPLGTDPDSGDAVVVRIGKTSPFVQRGEGGQGNTAFVPDDMAPAELTLERALQLLSQDRAQPEALGKDPNTGRCVFHKTGRYGAYLELDGGETGTPKRVTLPPGVRPADLSDSDLGVLMSFPRALGNDPESGEPVTVALGRYGAYLTCGERKGNVGDWRDAATMSLDAALEVLKQGRATSNGARSGPQVLREFGNLDGLQGEVKLLSGRYGPYLTDGKTNATLPKGLEPDSITPEKAIELIQAKAAAGPSKKRRFVRRRKS